MDIDTSTAKILYRIRRFKGQFINGLTNMEVTNKHYYTLVRIEGEEKVCAIPQTGAWPVLLGVKKGQARCVSTRTLRFQTRRLGVPGQCIIQEIERLNAQTAKDGRDMRFIAYIDIDEDSIRPL
jgi:hypothetical protein